MAEDAILIEPTTAAGRKRGLRAALRAQRLALPAVDRMRDAEGVADILRARPDFPDQGYVAGYWAMDGELPLHVLQMRLRDRLVWCLPCIQADRSLRFAPWRPGDELVANRYGIPEPALSSDAQLEATQMAAILVPLLGFTRAGARLGMGGGFYDRSLAARGGHPPPLLVGVAYPFQQLDEIPAEPWDIRLDAVVTAREYIDCHSNA